MTNHIHSPRPNGGLPDCPLCMFRELSEGTPRIWTPGTPGQKVTGAVLALGQTMTPFNTQVPHVDLWMGGTERIRVVAYGATLSEGIRLARPQTGDTLEITYEGTKTLRRPGWKEERPYRSYSVVVTRGHH